MPAGRPTKLTATTIATVCQAIRTGTPIPWAARRADVDDGTLRKWRQVATKGAAKKPNQRSQHERRCVEFFAEVDRAEADFFTLGTAMIAQAARDSTLTRTVTDPDGNLTTTRAQQAGDWRAMAHLLALRFPEMNPKRSVELSGPEGGPIRTVSNDEVWSELEQLRRERAALTSTNGQAALTNGHG